WKSRQWPWCGEASVALEDEAVINPPGLVILERRKIRERGRFSLVEGFARQLLQAAPARPFESGSVGDLSQGAAPFDDHAVDVARAKQVRDPLVFGHRIVMDRRNDEFRPRTVLGWHAVFEIPGSGLESVVRLAYHGEAPRPAILFTAEAEAGIEVGQVVNEFVQRIGFILQRGGN